MGLELIGPIFVIVFVAILIGLLFRNYRRERRRDEELVDWNETLDNISAMFADCMTEKAELQEKLKANVDALDFDEFLAVLASGTGKARVTFLFRLIRGLSHSEVNTLEKYARMRKQELLGDKKP